MISHKRCSNCFKIKPVKEFYPRRISKDGYQTRCIPCNKEITSGYAKERRVRDSKWLPTGAII